MRPSHFELQAGRLLHFFGTSTLDETTHRLVAAELAKQTSNLSSPSGFIGPVVQV